MFHLATMLLRLDSPWGPYLVASMTLCYFVVFLYYMALGFYQLRSRPHHDVRTAVILYRLQVRMFKGLMQGLGQGHRYLNQRHSRLMMGCYPGTYAWLGTLCLSSPACD